MTPRMQEISLTKEQVEKLISQGLIVSIAPPPTKDDLYRVEMEKRVMGRRIRLGKSAPIPEPPTIPETIPDDQPKPITP